MDISSIRYAHRFDHVTGSAIREIFKVIAQPGMISFAGGNPSLDALPDRQVDELAHYVLEKDGKALLQYGATEGYPPFVESLKKYVESQLGVDIPAVLPVTGSTQAMDLLCKALIDPGDTVVVENPSFLGNLQCLKLYQANLVALESDDQGLIPEDLEKKIRQYHPKLLYTIPTFQNPTGKTLPEERRRKVAALASAYQMVVAEDDPYRDLRALTPREILKRLDHAVESQLFFSDEDCPQIPADAGAELQSTLSPASHAGIIPIERLKLSIRSYNCLKRAGLNTVEDILKRGTLEGIRNLGPRCIAEIEDRIRELFPSMEDRSA